MLVGTLASQQPKHSRDIAAVLQSRRNQLDFNYIDQWVKRLGLASVWRKILATLKAGTNCGFNDMRGFGNSKKPTNFFFWE